jgi:RHS repeat-associated protein
MRSTKSGDGTDAKWQLLLYSYDAEGRVVKKNTYTEGLPALGYVITYSYNRQGQQVFSLVKVGTSTTHQLYQWQDYQANRGLLEKATYATTSTKPASAQQSLSYDAAGLVTSRQYQGQASVPYAYNARDGLVSIGSVTSTTYPFSASYTYQRNGQVLVTDYHNKQSASVNDRYQVLHRYDGLGRLLQADYCHFALITSSACTSVNHYDVTGITYDRQGNLLTLNRRDATGTRVDSLLYGYQAGRNRLSSLTERAGASSATWDAEAGSFTCDKSGNVMTMPAPWNVSASVYDARNLPVSVSVTVGSVTTTTKYRYNSQGQRYWKQVGSSSGEFYVLDGSVVLGLFSETGTRTYWNYVAGGEVFARVSGGIRKYYSKDHLGSVRAVQEETGVVIEAEDYDAWGVAMTGRSYLSGVGAKEGYTGKERDAETGLDYFGARYYLSAIGRWGAVDALSEKYPELSPYNYVANNPLLYIDINGDSLNVSQIAKDEQQALVTDLTAVSGLPLAVDNSGNIVVVDVLRGPGGGSFEAAKFLRFSVDHPATVKVRSSTEGSRGVALRIEYDNQQVQSFIEGTPSQLDPRTLGFGLTFLHELNHTSLGALYHGSSSILTDPKSGTATGPVVDHINAIRRELGPSFGQRDQYLGVSVGGNKAYIPFVAYVPNQNGTGYKTYNTRITYNRK